MDRKHHGVEPGGAASQVEEQTRVGQGVAAQGHGRLVAENLAFAVEPCEEPADQRMEEESRAEQLLGELGPVVVSRQVRQLVQQAGAPVRLRPVAPICRQEHDGS